VDDELEDADAPPLLHARTYAQLVLCDGDTDDLRYELAAGEALQVVLRHAPGAGDLGLTIRSVGAGGRLLGSSNGRHGVEVVGVDAAEEERLLRIVVDGRPGFDTPYQLSLQRREAGYCAPDVHEGPLGNDDAEHAARVGPGELDHVLCPGDEDWFSVYAPAGVSIVARATPEEFAGSVRVSIHRANGNQLAQGGPVGPAMIAEADVLQAGRYLVRVRPVQDDVRVASRLELGATPLANARDAACPGHGLLAGQPWLLPRALPARRFPTSCGGPIGVDHIGRFDLPTPAFVTVRFVGDEGGTALALFGECDEPASERACGFDVDGTLDRVALAAGTWFVVAVTPAGGRAAVLVEVEAQCLGQGDCPQGQVCETGLCVAACVDNDDCDGMQTCDVSGRCIEPAGCGSDDDCAGRRVCEHGACLLPDCQLHADCGAEACVDRRCEAGVPAECGDGEPCPGNQLCSDRGTCVLDADCDEDADCPGSAPICDEPTSECVGCRDNDDCAGAELCRERRCAYLGFCEDDDECPGTRACGDGGECEPADDCEDDLFAGLQDAPVLEHRAYTGLVLCDGTTDRFLASVPRETALRVLLRHPQGDADLALSLRNPATLDEIAAADGHDGVDSIWLGASAFQRDLEIVVSGRPGFSTDYTISLERQPAEFCAPDALEGPLGNDDPDHATPVGLGMYAHELCPGDQDHFAVHLPAGARLTAEARPLDADPADLSVTLRGPDGAQLGVGAVGDVAVAAGADVTVTGLQTIGVSFAQADEAVRVDLQLGASAADDALGLACADAGEILPGAPFEFEPTLQVRRFQLGCGVGWGGDYLGTFELDDAATIRVEVLDDPVATTVSVRTDCEAIASEVGCGMGVQVPVEDVALEAGTYWVALETTDDPPPPIRILLID